MSVNWLWKNKLGEMHYKTPKGKYKTILYCANCLGCEIYHNDKEHYTFQGFWNNKEHLQNILGLTKKYKNNNVYKDMGLYKVRLNTFWLKDTMIIAKEFAKAKIKVELYYKEIK